NGASLPFPGGPRAEPPGPHSVLAIDLDFDARDDLVLAGAGGLKFYHQTSTGAFEDVTARTKLPASVLGAAYTGAWAFDYESDGDLDVVLGSASGEPTVLRNALDGTWTALHPFHGISGLRDFVWADLDNDGSNDASIIDGAGRLHVFANQRAGLYRERAPAPALTGATAAIAAADVTGSGSVDLVALQAGGAIMRIADKNRGEAFEVAEIARWAPPPADLSAGSARLLVADLDNNGGLDLVASTPTAAKAWLCDEKHALAPLSAAIPGPVFAAGELSGNGRLDLIGLSPAGQPVRMASHGSKDYRWQDVRPIANDQEFAKYGQERKDPRSAASGGGGDRRSNSFGIGGVMELRAGLLYCKQTICSPVVHFGLGTYQEADVVRVLWPNGDVRSEYAQLSDNPMVPNTSSALPHRLDTSCPWLFAWNGHKMGFVTDFIWRSPVGLRINAQDTAGMEQTEDWVKIAGDQLVPRDGYYDLRITAELWETHFFDYVRLMTVDHPAGTEIFVDERFSIPPPPLKVYCLTPPVPVARALDDNGTDVTDIVRDKDGRYLDTFGRGDYQGITRDHYVDFEVGPDAPKTGPLYLVASGWIHPTNSSINVAISQGRHDPPRGLSLEVQDADGKWRTVKDRLGFPAGKTKTILIRLDDVAQGPRVGAHVAGTPTGPRTAELRSPVSRTPSAVRTGVQRYRLRTNLEIYWDSLAIAGEAPGPAPLTRRLPIQSAELRYRGYSATSQANSSSPELPDYETLDGGGQRWRDLIGYCTRFGDVKPLLEQVDDRYVIMNAGDEMAFRFAEQPPPPAGWKRDYVLVGDGWEKDGNLNTVFSKTILPLPFHGQQSYNTPPGRLEDDPVVRRHPDDWKTYHTRYVTPDAFRNGLKPGY
ncbi:MAG TPA: CRTAC1 family protein, partial [Chthonomonadaceae bacterium]|nr:CRTAC1 family protein [Chthonomonadaceae bacterium]